MTKRQRAAIAIEKLKELYLEATCSLTYEHPYQLLIATRLSAQCTDARVNIVTKVLFEKYPTLRSLAEAKYEDVEEIVRPCGLGKTKAKDIIKMSNQLINDYDGKVPDSIEELTKLSGVGRKTANLIVGDIYGKPSIVTDTHCIRICARLGLTDGSTVPLSVENQLRKIIPSSEGGDFCHRLVHFGREWCTARSPKCQSCYLGEICKNKTGIQKKTLDK